MLVGAPRTYPPRRIWEDDASFFFFVFLGPHLQHTKVPKLGVPSELWPPAYTTATATPDLSHIGDLHHSSQQHWILNPLREARDQTLMDASRVH